MTPPDTNLEKQKRRHRPVLSVMLAGLVLVLVAGLAYMMYIDDPDLPGPTESDGTAPMDGQSDN